MNKKFLSAILFGALMVTSTGTFVSCSDDYDDDIARIDSELSDLSSKLDALQTKIDAGNYVTNVAKSGDGIVVTWADGTTSTIETIKGDKGDKGEAVTITIDPTTKNWLIDGEDTGICAEGKDGTATEGVSAKSPSIDETTGNWVVYSWDAEKQEYLGTDTGVSAKGASAYVTEDSNYYLLHVATSETGAEYTEVKLPKHAIVITELEFVGYTQVDGTFVPFQQYNDANSGANRTEDHNKYVMPYSAFYFAEKDDLYFKDADASQEVKETIAAKTAISALAGASLVVRVAPASVDLSAYDLSLINSQLAEAPIALEAAEAYKGLITRASSANGLWSIPLTSKTIANVNSVEEFEENFEVESGQVAFAIKASDVDFISNYNLVFNNVEPKSTDVKLNGTIISGSTYGTEDAGLKINLNAKNTFTLTVPTSVYKSQILVDELYADRWGVTVDGNSFTVTKFYDKQTVPAFPVHFWYYDLKTKQSVKKTVYVQLVNSISDLTTLTSVAHTIPTDANKDNFTYSLNDMYTDLGTSGTLEWKERVQNATMQVYQVGTNADGSDKAVSGDFVQFLDSNNNVTTNYKNAVNVKVNLNHTWPADDDHALDESYYVLVKFTDGSDVLNSVKLPFTLSIPAMSNLFKEQSGVFVGGVANAYMDATATSSAVAPEYTIKSAFESFKNNLGTSTFTISLDGDDTKISGNKYSKDLATFTDGTTTATSINVSASNAEILKIRLNTSGVTINADNTPEGYKKELIAEVTNVKYLGIYSYGDETYTFKIKVMSPILEGKVTAVGGEVTIPATDLEGYKVNDSHIKGYTYNDIVYSIFYKAGTTTWARKEIKDVSFAVPTASENLFSVGTLQAGTAKTSTAAEVPSHVVITPKNLAETTTGDLSVTVTDAWGYTLNQTIKVTVKVGE